MQLPQYLMCVAARHDQAKDEHENELRDQKYLNKKSKRDRKWFTLTYEDEAALLKGVIASVRGKPSCLKKLTLPAIGTLAYILKAKMANDPYVEGHEIVDKLVCDPERTIDYLNGLAELKELEWIRIIDTPGMGFTDQPPFCWLQAYLELGDTFHDAMGVSQQYNRSFTSNDAYLDAAFAYLQAIIQSNKDHFQVMDPAADLATLQPEGWFRSIVLRVKSSKCEIPAAEAQIKYSLSTFQYLALLGLLGMRDGDLTYDFSVTGEVTYLFARGRVCRKLMREHLFGEQSPLIRQRLVEATHGSYGEAVKLTQLGIKALTGKQSGKGTPKDLKHRVKKNTLFDFEEPKVKKASLHLPDLVMEALRSLIFSESRIGRQIRKSWHTSLPAAWGSPTGSTVLLYGPPGIERAVRLLAYRGITTIDSKTVTDIAREELASRMKRNGSNGTIGFGRN